MEKFELDYYIMLQDILKGCEWDLWISDIKESVQNNPDYDRNKVYELWYVLLTKLMKKYKTTDVKEMMDIITIKIIDEINYITKKEYRNIPVYWDVKISNYFTINELLQYQNEGELIDLYYEVYEISEVDKLNLIINNFNNVLSSWDKR